jgi:hypothetical protein
MANAEGIPDLGPLPKSDDNAELQRSSIKALNSLLQSQDAILFRDERTEDYGVDGTFELKIRGGMTNFRAQVQLKAATHVEANEDGSASYSVRTANLNYLLNGTSSIYLLFDAKKNEFWYVWAQDESRRLEAVNPGWKEQEQVTLRFNKRLDANALGMIVERIMAEGRMHRQIHDSLARATTSDHVVVSIDAASLTITDPTEAQHILLASGPAIIAAGYPKQALHLLDLVVPTLRNLPRLQLTAGYAEYMLGKHYNALGHIRQAIARAQELSESERAFLFRLKDACEFHVGIIDAATYQHRTDERARALSGVESLLAQLDGVYYRFLRERNPDHRSAFAKEARTITSRILSCSEGTGASKLGAKLILLYIDGTEATLAATHQMALSQIHAKMFSTHTKDTVEGFQQAMTRLANWEMSSKEALKTAVELRHPILIGEAHLVVLSVRIGQLMNLQLESLCCNKKFEFPEPAKTRVLQSITSALAICELNQTVEGRLRVNKLQMDFFELAGDMAGAKELAARILPEAEAMGFAVIAEQAKELLEDRTLLRQFENELTRIGQSDQDIWVAQMSDDEVQRYSREILLSVGSPPGRPEVIDQCCRNFREIARERCHWCRHLELLEDLRRTTDPATAFSVLPDRKCVCEKFGHESKTTSPDAQALIVAFKQLYCAGCKDRAPKQAR